MLLQFALFGSVAWWLYSTFRGKTRNQQAYARPAYAREAYGSPTYEQGDRRRMLTIPVRPPAPKGNHATKSA
jgi:hypothetical protein